MTAPEATGRGVGRCMCQHSFQRARDRVSRAMQFNFVVATDERAKVPHSHRWHFSGKGRQVLSEVVRLYP